MRLELKQRKTNTVMNIMQELELLQEALWELYEKEKPTEEDKERIEDLVLTIRELRATLDEETLNGNS